MTFTEMEVASLFATPLSGRKEKLQYEHKYDFLRNCAGAEQQLCAKRVCAGLPCGVQVTDNWSAHVRRQFHNLGAGWPAVAQSR